MRERVALVRHHQDVGRGVREPALEDLLPLVDLLHGCLAGLRVDEGSQPVQELVAHPVVVARVDDAVDLSPREVDRDALAGGADRGVGLRLGPVHRLRQGHLPVQPERVVDLPRDLPHGAPLHRTEHVARRREVEVSEFLQQAVHVHGARARLEPVVRDEQDQVVGPSAGDERAERLVDLAEDVGGLAADPRVLVRQVVGVVGRDVVR